MKEEQKRRIENRLTLWSEQSFKALELWTKYSDEGRTEEAAAMRRRMIAIDGKIDAALEIIGILGYTVIWTDGKAVIVVGK